MDALSLHQKLKGALNFGKACTKSNIFLIGGLFSKWEMETTVGFGRTVGF
jgi:hypothetical protein